MIAIKNSQYITPQEYLEWEEKQPIKYEYIDGQIIAMTGGTIPHSEIVANLTTALKNHLRGKGCKVLVADAKVEISEQGPFFYPDVMVSCDERDKKARQAIEYPCLIIEVLSPGTESFDRGKKFQNYRRISTLKEYVLVSANEIMLECFQLNEKGVWEFYSYQEGDNIELKNFNFSCPIDLIYEDVFLGE